MKASFLIVFLTYCITSILAQPEVIHLKNPSFEDYPRAERVPEGWRNCGFKGESAPDTHPSGFFDVIEYPADGNTYLGLVTRDNDTWERVGQKLVTPMIAGQCYVFKISLCRSELYTSASRSTGQRASYTKPIKLKIWGGNYLGQEEEVLGESGLINHVDWENYIFIFQPTVDYTYFMLEAFYKEPSFFPYNGNLLIDNASPIIPVPCDSNWTEKYETIIRATPRKYVRINDEDRDATAKNTATVTVARIGKTKQFPPIPIPTIYYHSKLTEREKELALEEIKTFVENNPFAKANIIIEEKTKKERKEQKKILIQQLTDLDIREDRYSISLYKN